MMSIDRKNAALTRLMSVTRDVIRHAVKVSEQGWLSRQKEGMYGMSVLLAEFAADRAHKDTGRAPIRL